MLAVPRPEGLKGQHHDEYRMVHLNLSLYFAGHSFSFFREKWTVRWDKY